MPELRPLGHTGLAVSALGLGTNTFGWTADEATAHAILDRYVAAGGNHLDTAQIYPGWAPGCEGGESETMIGSWLHSNPSLRGRLVVATKLGMAAGRFEKGLRRDQIMRWIEGSLQRLQVEHIDLLYTHEDDPDTPLTETLAALDELVRQGVVSHLGASNLPPERLAESLRLCAEHGWAPYRVLQPQYNLIARSPFEGPMRDLCLREGIAVVPYPALGSGFLTGKYRPGQPLPESVRAGGASAALAERGAAVLEALDVVAAETGATVAQVAIAWLAAQPTVVSALASARTLEQLEELLPALELQLSEAQQARLATAAA